MDYRELISRLKQCGSAAPEHEAAELVRVFDRRDRSFCLMNPTAGLSDKIDAALKKREAGIPLAYILGEAWFFGYRFAVSPDCLIPQPDTEHIVDKAIGALKEGGAILDLCTGSGCIAISILKETVNTTATAVDISAPALEVAKENARLHGVEERIRFIKADVLHDALSPYISSADVILSNPPYINTDVIDGLSEEVRHEPRIALDGGADGMDFYRHFIRVIPPCMKPGAKIFFEIGYDQADRITALCSDAGLSCVCHRDFGGNFRVAEISRGNSADTE